MKRIILAAMLIAMVFATGALFAQESKPAVSTSSTIRDPSEMYPFRLDVVKIYQHSLGYRVVYRVGQDRFADAFIPMAWFKAGGKAQLIRSNDPSHPYMVVYYRAGKFSHVRLFVKDYQKDPSWGILEGGSELASKFQVEEIVPKF